MLRRRRTPPNPFQGVPVPRADAVFEKMVPSKPSQKSVSQRKPLKTTKCYKQQWFFNDFALEKVPKMIPKGGSSRDPFSNFYHQGAQVDPKWPQGGPKVTKMTPKWVVMAPNTVLRLRETYLCVLVTQSNL